MRKGSKLYLVLVGLFVVTEGIEDDLHQCHKNDMDCPSLQPGTYAQFNKIIFKGKRIYHDRINDIMLLQPNWCTVWSTSWIPGEQNNSCKGRIYFQVNVFRRQIAFQANIISIRSWKMWSGWLKLAAYKVKTLCLLGFFQLQKKRISIQTW